MSPTPTIFEWAGGRPAFERWFDAFYDMVERDELLGPVFGGRVTEAHRRNVTTWWCEVMGGPADYTEAEGGYAHRALHNSQPGADVAAHAPVPRWGWGVAPPYEPG